MWVRVPIMDCNDSGYVFALGCVRKCMRARMRMCVLARIRVNSNDSSVHVRAREWVAVRVAS